MKIKIQSTRIIKPSKPTPQQLRNFKLSLFDQFVPCSVNIDLILYFQATGEVNVSDKCTQLINSLSEVLTLFYPLAGRLTQDGLEVDCNDQGITYLETQVTPTLDHFFQQHLKIDCIRQLVGTPDQVTASLLTVQVNVFSCGSLVVGVSATHRVTDTCNLARFINAWASANRSGGTTGAFDPSFDNLASVFPPRSEIKLISPLNKLHKPTNIVDRRFVFTGDAITKLRAEASSRNCRHSRVTLVTSLIWKAFINIDKLKLGIRRDCLLSPVINLRGKTSSPISESSFGNVWVPYVIRFSQNETKDLKYVDLVALVEDITRDVIKWLKKASVEEICRYTVACDAEVREEVKQRKFCCLFTSFCWFPIYKADFGWGGPSWASTGGSLIEIVTLMDDKHGDGIEAWVSLKEKDMDLFEKDADILAFVS